MSGLVRHVGKMNNTGTRVVVVFRKLPDDPSHALVVESDALPERYHDNLMTIVRSDEAQDTFDLYSVLNRRTFSDGGVALTVLHQKGLLRKVRVEDVTLYPIPNHALPLSRANEEIDRNSEDDDTITQIQESARNQEVSNGKEDNVLIDTGDNSQRTERERHEADVNGENQELTQEQIKARSALEQAKILEDEATRKKETAYKLDPDLKPKRGRPPASDEQKNKTNKDKQKRRNERDKEAKKDSKKEKAAMEKIMRDESRASTEGGDS